MGEVRGVHQHLGGDAAQVQAGAAEHVLGPHPAVDLDDAAPGELGAREGVGRSGADQGDVEVLRVSGHPARLRVPAVQ